jgi:hypothetical protein
MYVAPESKVMMAMANVVSTSPEAETTLGDDTLPPDEF